MLSLDINQHLKKILSLYLNNIVSIYVHDITHKASLCNTYHAFHSNTQPMKMFHVLSFDINQRSKKKFPHCTYITLYQYMCMASHMRSIYVTTINVLKNVPYRLVLYMQVFDEFIFEEVTE